MQFQAKRKLAVIALIVAIAACEGNTPSTPGPILSTTSTAPVSNPDNPGSIPNDPAPPAPLNQLSFQNANRPLSNGIAQTIGDNRNHYRVDVQISDGQFRSGFYMVLSLVYAYWFAADDTAIFSADLYASSTRELTPGQYTYVDISAIRGSDSTFGQSVFSQAFVGWDFNGDGNVDDDEQMDIVEGTLIVTGTDLSSLNIEFDVLLVNGENAKGQYSNGFTLVN